MFLGKKVCPFTKAGVYREVTLYADGTASWFFLASSASKASPRRSNRIA